jgi:Fur family ferric uptake transcriptional regulator
MSCAITLKQKGYRLTPQRKLILDIIHSTTGHLSADDIYGLVAEKMPGVNRSTVYRTLDLLESLGLVVKSELDNRHIYHHSNEGHQHHHLICRRCGQVINCNEQLTTSLEKRLLKDYDFQADLHHKVIYGLCRKCR